MFALGCPTGGRMPPPLHHARLSGSNTARPSFHLGGFESSPPLHHARLSGSNTARPSFHLGGFESSAPKSLRKTASLGGLGPSAGSSSTDGGGSSSRCSCKGPLRAPHPPPSLFASSDQFLCDILIPFPHNSACGSFAQSGGAPIDWFCFHRCRARVCLGAGFLPRVVPSRQLC